MQKFPEILSQLHQLEFDYADGDGIDFEPYQAFLSQEDVTDWFRAWTGNADANSDDYLVFGQDGSGGYAAIWYIEKSKTLLEQPIVFFGSEGELGVIASNFSDYLWLLACGHGAFEAVAYPDESKQPNEVFTAFAKLHATTKQPNIKEILEQANAKFPDFENQIDALCR
jgi:hypothetical protein